VEFEEGAIADKVSISDGFNVAYTLLWAGFHHLLFI